MLDGLLPRIITNEIPWQIIHFNGKTDLEKQLPAKLRYWREPDTFFIILRDKDSEDCQEIKNRLINICREANKDNYLVRIACYALENWYLGDLKAIGEALSISNLSQQQNKRKFQNPDLLSNSYDELLKLTSNKYQKVSGSRAIGPYLSLTENRSNSFRVFISGIQRALSTLQGSF